MMNDDGRYPSLCAAVWAFGAVWFVLMLTIILLAASLPQGH